MPEAKETPADKAKREAAEKQAAESPPNQQEPEDPPLTGDAAKEAERIMVSDEGANTVDEEQPRNDPAPWLGNFRNEEQANAAQTAAKQLYAIACEFPQSTPDTHTVFGFGGKLFKLGDLRALFGLRRG